jgi:hypothetical protein
MTRQQALQQGQHLQDWRKNHPDAASLQAAYRQQIIDLTLNSMALEQEPMDAARLKYLLAQPVR